LLATVKKKRKWNFWLVCCMHITTMTQASFAEKKSKSKQQFLYFIFWEEQTSHKVRRNDEHENEEWSLIVNYTSTCVLSF
jgi:hypothetical protein